MSHTILIVDNDAKRRNAIRLFIENNTSHKATTADSGKHAVDTISQNDETNVDLVLLDFSIPEMGGMDTLKAITELKPNLPVIVLTDHADVTTAVETMQAGAMDFIARTEDNTRLEIAIQNAFRCRSA